MEKSSTGSDALASKVTPIYAERAPESSNIVRVEFRPEVSRRIALKHIGELAAAATTTFVGDDGNTYEIPLEDGTVLSSEPIPTSLKSDRRGNYELLYKQVIQGPANSEGANFRGHRGTENVQVSRFSYDASSGVASKQAIEARNLRWILPSHEGLKQTPGGYESLEALKREIKESRKSVD